LGQDAENCNLAGPSAGDQLAGHPHDEAVNQREMAAQLGMAQRRLWAIESGAVNISMRLLGEIAHSLRVTPAELLTPGAFQAPT
jgi:transcriptional regulator with XRE-family HTH domain